MEKLKACMGKSLTGGTPSDDEVAAAVIEVVDVIASIADSLIRIADAAERRLMRDPALMAEPIRVEPGHLPA